MRTNRGVAPLFIAFVTVPRMPGLRHDTYEGVMKGTQFGKVIIPGDPAQSSLVSLIKHESDPKIFMPFHQEKVSPNRIRNIENWIRYQAPNN